MTSLEQAFIRAVGKATDQRGKPAVLGRLDGVLYWVDPNGMTHRTRVWARIGEQNSNQLVVVDCLKVPPQIDMPVRVDYVNGVLSVIDVDNKRAVEFGGGRSPGNGGAHAWMHSRLGPDPVYIEGLQYLPLAVTPNVPTPDLTVLVQPGAYYDLSGDLQVIDTAVASGSVSAYVPGSGYHFVIICLDRSDGSVVIVDGDDVSGGGDALFPTATVTAADIEAIAIDPDYWPLGVVLLTAGQTQIRAKDIVKDLRPLAGAGGGGGTPGGADGAVQYNNGGVLGGFGTWNDATETLTLADTKATANLIISTSGDDNQASIQFSDGTSTYVFGVNETNHGIWLGSGTDLDTLPLFGIDSSYFYLGGDSSSYRVRVDPSGGEVLLRLNTIFRMPGFAAGGEVFYAEGDSFGIGRSSSYRFDIYEPEGSYPLYERHGANLDAIGPIVEQSFYADDSTGAETDYVKMIVSIDDPTNGSEDGSVVWSRMIGGALTDVFTLGGTNEIVGNTDIIGNAQVGASGAYAQIGSGGIVFNDGEADIDIRWGGNGVTNAYYYDAGLNRHGFGTGTPGAVMHVVAASGTIAIFEENAAGEVGMNSMYNPNTTDSNGALIRFDTDTTGTGAAARSQLAQFGVVFSTHNHATRTGNFVFRNYQSGSFGTRVTIGAGVVVGSPTGGDKGAGTINAVAVYDDNVLLSDYVFEPDYPLLSIDEMTSFFETNKHLPTIPGRDEWEAGGKFSLGQLANNLWETVEVQALYISQLHQRLTRLEHGN